ncbi:MAG: hypothetical protein JW780_03980 [Clostridiales bacterium]|nr:hypothetical protein [Clostridiales bacterium]
MPIEPYYKSSNQVRPVRLLVLLLVTILSGSAISVFYLLLVRIIPFVYVVFLITLLFGLLTGAIGALVCHWLKIRNSALAVAVSSVGILVFTYVKWAAFISYHIQGSYTFVLPDLLRNPFYLLEKIIQLNEFGTWSIGESGNMVNGVILAIVWLFEFIIYAFIHLILIYAKTTNPFIEKENAWAKQHKSTFYLRVFDVKRNVSEIEKDPKFLLEQLEKKQYAETGNHVELQLFHSADFSENYINVSEMTVNSKNGKSGRRIIKNLSVSRDFVRELFNYYDLSMST